MAKTKADRIMEMAANVALSEIGAGPEITGFSNRDDARAALAALVDEVAPAPADPALLALAKLGAWLVNEQWWTCEDAIPGFLDMDGEFMDQLAVKCRVSVGGGASLTLAPGIADAISALLDGDA